MVERGEDQTHQIAHVMRRVLDYLRRERFFFGTADATPTYGSNASIRARLTSRANWR